MGGGDVLGRSIDDDDDDNTPHPEENPPPQSPSPPPPPSPSPPSPSQFRTPRPLPGRQPFSFPVPRVQPRSPAVVWFRGRGQRGRGGRGQIFEDPAVVKSVRVRPSLKVRSSRGPRSVLLSRLHSWLSSQISCVCVCVHLSVCVCVSPIEP